MAERATPEQIREVLLEAADLIEDYGRTIRRQAKAGERVSLRAVEHAVDGVGRAIFIAEQVAIREKGKA